MSWFAILFSLGDIINFYNQFPSLDGIILVSDEASCAWLQAMPVSLHRLQCPLSDFSSAAGLCHHHQNCPPVMLSAHGVLEEDLGWTAECTAGSAGRGSSSALSLMKQQFHFTFSISSSLMMSWQHFVLVHHSALSALFPSFLLHSFPSPPANLNRNCLALSANLFTLLLFKPRAFLSR